MYTITLAVLLILLFVVFPLCIMFSDNKSITESMRNIRKMENDGHLDSRVAALLLHNDKSNRRFGVDYSFMRAERNRVRDYIRALEQEEIVRQHLEAKTQKQESIKSRGIKTTYFFKWLTK